MSLTFCAMYSLSRAGYYPKVLSLTGKRQTPFLALIVGAVITAVAVTDRARGAGRQQLPAESGTMPTGSVYSSVEGCSVVSSTFSV